MCCSVLQCVAVRCSALQCVAVRERYNNTFAHDLALTTRVLYDDFHELLISGCVAVCRSVLQCVAAYCSVLQCVAVRCSALQCVAVCERYDTFAHELALAILFLYP